MWQEIFDFFSIAAAVVFCAAAVKLADDYLDREFDAIAGKANWADRLGRGTMLYAMFLLALAAGINTPLSLSLFLASYVIGMFNSMRTTLPSRLTGFQESLLALLAGMVLFGWNNMFFAFSFVLAVQLFDDCLDIHSDQIAGQRNLAKRFGGLECMVAGAICIVAAWGANEELFLPVVFGSTLVYLGSLGYERVRS